MHDRPQDEPQVFEVTPTWHRKRADKALSAHLSDWSRSQVQKLFSAGRVWREDEAIDKGDKVFEGDSLTFQPLAVQPAELRSVDLPLEVIWEDDDLIAVNKAPGMVVHPGAGTGEDTLVHALLHYCRGQLSGIGGVERPGIIHRLDRETSGIIVAAKTDRGFQGMARLFLERKLEKVYRAIVTQGVPEPKAGAIHAAIGRHPVHRTRMTVREDGRAAHSEWAVEEVFPEDCALLWVRIHTGRTHQIRVHLSHLGYPLAGDPLYGFKAARCPVEIPRVMLHAAELRFAHPLSGAAMDLRAPLPADMMAVCRALKERTA
jgi:23S rRNA pseudouridine1911/1915/1917 synthase